MPTKPLHCALALCLALAAAAAPGLACAQPLAFSAQVLIPKS